MPIEKKNGELKLRIPESLETDLMRLAAQADRSLSDYVRHVLRSHVYGAMRLRDDEERD
jgi:predicted HicB family RNase H-like nuclease